MGDVKSAFVQGGYNGNNFILDSFSVIGDDTRKGLSPATATRLAAMQGYVSANPDKTNSGSFNQYVGKLMSASAGEPEVETKPVVAQRSKLGNGIK